MVLVSAEATDTVRSLLFVRDREEFLVGLWSTLLSELFNLIVRELCACHGPTPHLFLGLAQLL